MPPFLPRKRSSPPASTRKTPGKRARLADALDAENANDTLPLIRNRTFSLGDDNSSSDSSLSDIDSSQFEDVTVDNRKPGLATEVDGNKEDDDSEDENIVWEDADTVVPLEQPVSHIPMMKGSIQINLRQEDEVGIDYGTASKIGSGKKGPSQKEKRVRVMTHQLHVQFLLWHNAVRNNWIGDKKVQTILVKQLPPQIIKEVEKWKRASGLAVVETSQASQSKGKKRRKTKEVTERNQRDWGQPSLRLEAGKPDMSHGDPLIVLMRVLSAYWKKRFAITAPGLRKRGYGTKYGLKQDIVSLRNDEHDPERHGERIRTLAEFRQIAERGQGSRDVGAQLFTALLRGLGIEARLVASLQPSGYGWTKVEQMIPRKATAVRVRDDSSEIEEDDSKQLPKPRPKKKQQGSSARSRRQESKVINLDTDDNADNDDGEVSSNNEDAIEIKDDDSIVDITPSMPKQRRPKYDRDLTFPIYWTEVISPITNKVLPVSPLVLETPVATTPEGLSLFEPRGAKAEKGRQVIAYVVAYSPDGSAKDVTVRYLRKNIWPGKTKGFRLPIEKIPVYDKRGKVTRHEDFDWFKHILSLYTRSDTKRTAADDLEDSAELVPQLPERKNDDGGVDTLQSLKASADFVLERFLRREEALRPDAKPVRTFGSGKGDNYKEEPVYRRADVERCLSAESWHKEGRRPRLGEAPMKFVPVRAVTLTRKREAEEHERQFGEKQTQGLYSWDQTEWIIPAPIKDGVIPKNAYGNMDCFVPSMVPKGAVHIPLRGTVRICKKLEIDFAEAVTGFEFGNKRAVPVCTGVVIAKENEKLIKDAWQEWNEEQKRKEDLKLEKLVLDLWRKFVLGLRIRERVQDMYGEEIGVVQDLPNGFSKEDAITIDDNDDRPQDGGFLNHDEQDEDMGGGFLLPHEEEPVPMEDLIMEDHSKQPPTVSDARYPTPSSTGAEGSKAVLDDGQIELNSGCESDPSQPESVINHYDSSSGEKDMRHNAGFRNIAVVRRSIGKSKEPWLSMSDVPIDRGNSDAQEETKETEFENTDDDDEGEIYTPRPIRTRAARNSTARVSDATSSRMEHSGGKQTLARLQKKSDKKVPKTSIESTDEVSDDFEQTSVRSRGKVKGSGRGRGRPKKLETSSASSRKSPKRSSRLSRKDSALVTSPYFER